MCAKSETGVDAPFVFCFGFKNGLQLKTNADRPANSQHDAKKRVEIRTSPGESGNTFVQGHEVVLEVKVRKVLAVEQLSGQLLQAAARQVHRIHPLRGDLSHEDRKTKRAPRLKTASHVSKDTFKRSTDA